MSLRIPRETVAAARMCGSGYRRGLARDHFLSVLILILVGTGCGLIPPNLRYVVQMAPVSEMVSEEAYYVDPEDSSMVFRKPGVTVKVRYLSDELLNEEYADQTYREPNLNPYTYGAWRDMDLGYTPERFTVFQVTVHNVGYGKVMLDPGKVVLTTDRGDQLRYYDVLKREAKNSFEGYYRARTGPSGNDEYWYQERMGTVRASLYRRDKPVFKGQSYSGKLVFDPLHRDVKKARLLFRDFVLRFDATGTPVEMMDIEYRLKVYQRIVEVLEDSTSVDEAVKGSEK